MPLFLLIERERCAMVLDQFHKSDRVPGVEQMPRASFGVHAVHVDPQARHHIRQVAQPLQVDH